MTKKELQYNYCIYAHLPICLICRQGFKKWRNFTKHNLKKHGVLK